MPEPADYGARDRRHIRVDVFRQATVYTYPARPRDHRPLRTDYAAHARELLSQLTVALGDLPTPEADTRLRGGTLKPGAIVEVQTVPPGERQRVKAVKVPQTLEFPAQDIVVLRSKRNEDRTESAVLFVPDDAREYLRGRITEYGRDRRQPDIDRFEALETVKPAGVDALFVGDVDFTAPEAVWWELWLREADGHTERVVSFARQGGLDVHSNRLVFPDTTVVFIHAAAADIERFAARVTGAITEIRRATGTIDHFFIERQGGIGPHDWVADLAARVKAPPLDAPVVCALDTGVSASHPLLAPGLRGAWSYDEKWGTDDHYRDGGHGTPLLSLALYGDLEPLMSDRRPVVLTHAVESMKLLPPRGFPATKPPSYGFVTQGAVGLVEIERPNVRRSYCLATSTVDFPPSRPSSWSGAVDQIASGCMNGDIADGVPATQAPKRLVLVATGNVQGGTLEEVRPSQPLEDPAQSWNALSIGGFTTKDQPSEVNGWKPIVPANHRSPFSRGSQSLPEDLTPIKPEVLFEAGNMVMDPEGYCEWDPSVSLLAAGSDTLNQPLVPFWATSAAAGMAGQFIGRLQAALPALWPETIRALTVSSAEWPRPIRKLLVGRGAHWKTGTSSTRQRILREVGYGVPDVERAILSARNDVTLIAEAEIQPFITGTDGRSAVFNEMHYYDLPWPRSALEKLENESVIMKVALSYFIEPNLTGKAATRPETYRSFGLRFAMKKRTETDAQFLHRITASQGSEISETVQEPSYWLLGPKAVQAGSLHCDLWRGRAIELAGHDAIVIYPVGGWWKTNFKRRRMEDRGRYALVISIAAMGHDVDLHTEVDTLVNAKEIEAKAAGIGVGRTPGATTSDILIRTEFGSAHQTGV